MNALVEILNVRKVYRRDTFDVPVLNGITLGVPAGDFLALMGPSGSGKTTLLNLIAGIDRPTSGRVVVGGREISRLSETALAAWRARHVGFVFQLYNLVPVLNAYDNVEPPLVLPLQTPTQPPPRRRGGKLFLVWVIAIVIIIIDEQISKALHRFHISTGLVTFVTFIAALVCIAVTLYAFAVVIRWMLRRLFWRVGRRLFLSYVMIGVLPFFLFAILLLTIGYMIAGVMTQAALRGERQASLGQMESAALEYGLTGRKPHGALPTLEIYDTADASGARLPEWLKKSSFSGIVWRNRQMLLVVSHQFPEQRRTTVFVQPLDRAWTDQLQERGGMIVRDMDRDSEIDDLLLHSIGRKIIWADVTDTVQWDTGGASTHQLGSLIINPWGSLLNFYFGAEGSGYLGVLLKF